MRLKGGPSAAFFICPRAEISPQSVAVSDRRFPFLNRAGTASFFSQVPRRWRACEQRVARPESLWGFSRGRKPIGLRNCGTDRRSKTTSRFRV